MTEKEIAKLQKLIKKLREENKRLKNKNRELQQQYDHCMGRYKELRAWLDQLGRGSIQLFSEVKNQLESLHQKIEQFESDSPLSFLEL